MTVLSILIKCKAKSSAPDVRIILYTTGEVFNSDASCWKDDVHGAASFQGHSVAMQGMQQKVGWPRPDIGWLSTSEKQCSFHDCQACASQVKMQGSFPCPFSVKVASHPLTYDSLVTIDLSYHLRHLRYLPTLHLLGIKLSLGHVLDRSCGPWGIQERFAENKYRSSRSDPIFTRENRCGVNVFEVNRCIFGRLCDVLRQAIGLMVWHPSQFPTIRSSFQLVIHLRNDPCAIDV